MPGTEHWSHIGIDFVLKSGLFYGTSTHTFSPEQEMTRAMLVTVLYRMEGSPSVKGLKNNFTDVADDTWYTDAVVWANQNGVVNGVTETTFQPKTNITREQVAAILYRYAKNKGYDVTAAANLADFPDHDDVSAYAETAMAWANAAGLITGSGSGEAIYLNPRDSATRAQVAAILMRFVKHTAVK